MRTLDYLAMPWEHQAIVLIERFAGVADGAKPVVLMDEPEQSLDALAEASLWKMIAAADCSNLQVIVAKQSLHPLLQPVRYLIIEAVPGYAKKVCDLL